MKLYNFFRTLMTSRFASVSCAVLASSFALFAPSAAVAFNLIDSDNDGLYEGVTDLDLFDDGLLWNVDFVVGRGTEVYNDGFSFTTESEAEAALVAFSTIVFPSASGSGGWSLESSVNPLEDARGEFEGSFNLGYSEESEFFNFLNSDFEGDVFTIADRSARFREVLWSRFSLAEPDGDGSVSTPEPSLILGFITLGGLMLGSKRKTKG
ncbi:MAG: PEP-CTERM sorting domain-containing protein [Cyanobacteria bacterium P01_H01_bin.35]